MLLGILTAKFALLSGLNSKESYIPIIKSNPALKLEVFEILNSKCNVCHRWQNPFMVFKLKNMENRAKKINRMVFIERRMPKGNKIKLTSEEYTRLKNWLSTLNIY